MATPHIGYIIRSFFALITQRFIEKDILKRDLFSYLLVIFLLISAGVGVYFGYQWHNTRKEHQAQLAFGITLDAYTKQLEQEHSDFSAIAQEFNQGYQHYKHTSLAPFFLSLQADALIKAGDTQQALAVMDTLVKEQNTHTSMMPLFKTKRALLALDTDNEEVVQRGLDELKELSHDTHNIYRDYALYHLGMYHWVHDDSEQARVAWQDLLAIEQGDIYSTSVWAALASQALESIS